MFLISLWLYILFLIFIFWWFIIIRVNSYNYAKLNKNVDKYNIIFITLLSVLTIIWFICLFFNFYKTNYTIDENKINDSVYY